VPEQVAGTGAQMILANTYHLLLRPGTELIERMGGLHRFMNWTGPILTDSGGFQVFSLTDSRTIDEDGVTFRSPLDGRKIRLDPASSIEAQNQIGADVIMAFDDCPPLPVDPEKADGPDAPRHAVDLGEYARRNAEAVDRTIRWLDQCVEAHRRPEDQALFGIVQGGLDLAERSRCAEALVAADLRGYAIGGVSVGEGHEQLVRVVRHTAPLLPDDRPRYLMGVGYERDILEAVRAGVDLFDCVLPTRNGRNANAFTSQGPLRLRNAACCEDPGPIDPACDCPVCDRYSRSYLRHLFLAKEMLGPILVSIHNLRHYQRLLLDIRSAIRDDDWSLLNSKWPVLSSGPQAS
ncbi:MAG: tRNA guanosine(34) transglycosylase Tgt, partial [Phycisphaeraceae bacterium]|nr:tRNA guanosine(34) transglycosylase Tgt [Phycisphaeraceae bacterium]